MYPAGAIDSQKIRMPLSVFRILFTRLFSLVFSKNLAGVRHLTDVEHIEFRLK